MNWKNKIVGERGVCVEKWWKITRYECTLVRRDREWWNSVVPDIIKFWSEVVHYRKVGNEEVQKRIQGRKRGPRKKVFTIQEVWKARIKNDVRDIDKNPSLEMAEVKLRQWQRLSYVNDVVLNAYVKIMIELVNDNSSQAYIHLYKRLDKKSYNKAELGLQ